MKCPKCGQNIFNNPDYCINCGHILKEKNHFTISIKTLALIIIIFIAVGSSVVIGIMYGGTEKELNNFLKEEEQLGGNQEEESLKVINEEEYEESNFNTIKNYFGHYVIAKIIPTNKTPNEISNDENNFLNWPIDFMEHQLKISLNKMEWEIVNNLKLYINNDTNSFKELFPSLDKITLAMIIEGTSNATAKPIKYNFIINNNTLYLYTYNTLFELKPTTESYQLNDNFYKISYPKEAFSNELITKKITDIQTEFKNLVEEDTNYVIDFNYEKVIDDSIMFIIFNKTIAEPMGHAFYNQTTIAYDVVTQEIYGLFDYLNKKEIDINIIKNQYQEQISQLGINPDENPLTNDTDYYVLNKQLYILVEEETIMITLN